MCFYTLNKLKFRSKEATSISTWQTLKTTEPLSNMNYADNFQKVDYLNKIPSIRSYFLEFKFAFEKSSIT